MIKLEYRHGCPACGGRITNLELEQGLLCKRCSVDNVYRDKMLKVFSEELEELCRFFRFVVGFEPWSLQRYWMKRLLAGDSFAMIAPTGMGKSTLLAVYAVYRALFYGWKVYILTPTREIAYQFYRKIDEILKRIDESKLRVIFYDSSSRSSRSLKDLIKNGDFDILITSATFLSRNYDIVKDLRVDLVIADDLDALLKESKNVDRVLKLLGFSDEHIEIAYRIVKLRQTLSALKLSNSSRIEDLRAELIELEAKLKNSLAETHAQFVVASATGRVRGLKPRVLRELIGFEGGAMFEYWRNIVDVHIKSKDLEKVLYIIKLLKSGIVFVSRSVDRDLVEQFLELLRREGVNFSIVKSGSKAVEKFRRGEVDVLIGAASYYGILVRGLDEPLRVRFVVFLGIPTIMNDVTVSLSNVRFLYNVLVELRKLGVDVEEVEKYVDKVKNVILRSTPAFMAMLSKWIRGVVEVPSPDVEELVQQLRNIVDDVKQILERILTNRKKFIVGNAVIVKKNDRIVVLKPDPYTYIQASGRCSRLLGGRKTFGIAVIVEDHDELIGILEKRLRRYIPNFIVQPLDRVDLFEVLKKVEETRRLDVGNDIDVRRSIRTALIVVESPTKARTIANMFGKPGRRVVGESIVYETVIPVSRDRIYVALITASLGHVSDLVTDEAVYGVRIESDGYVPIYDFIARCRSCGAQFVGVVHSCPYCGSMNILSSYSILNTIKRLAMDVDEVYIATDPDVEGEKIAYDLYVLLKPLNNNIFRIEFHEITRNAFLEAMMNPRAIDRYRVYAQIVRRIADRWIGFEISLWLQRVFDAPWLGAGRVQSPVLLWVVDRYRQYRENYGYVVVINIGGTKLRIFAGTGAEGRKRAEEITKEVLEKGLIVEDYTLEVREVAPPPPFTTDELLYEASRRFGLLASKIMSIAQTLFESGLITYHRTDSTRISSLGIAIAREALEKMGLQHLFIGRSWSEKMGAHEAIRPTTAMSAEELRDAVLRGDLGNVTRISDIHIKVYDLIFRRFLASQMRSARIEFLKLKLRILDRIIELEVPSNVVEPGFTVVYPIKTFSELKDVVLRSRVIRVSEQDVKIIRGSTVRLYTSADLVRLLKERGIGRPSTYAKAIDNNARHGYIIFSKKRKYVIPTKLGIRVADVLREYFLDLVGEEVTRELEHYMDLVENHEKEAKQILDIVRSKIDAVMSYVERMTPSISEALIDKGLIEAAS